MRTYSDRFAGLVPLADAEVNFVFPWPQPSYDLLGDLLRYVQNHEWAALSLRTRDNYCRKWQSVIGQARSQPAYKLVSIDDGPLLDVLTISSDAEIPGSHLLADGSQRWCVLVAPRESTRYLVRRAVVEPRIEDRCRSARLLSFRLKIQTLRRYISSAATPTSPTVTVSCTGYEHCIPALEI